MQRHMHIHDQNDDINYDNRSQVRNAEAINSKKKFIRTSMKSFFFCNCRLLISRTESKMLGISLLI